jgi:hypothetical protein
MPIHSRNGGDRSLQLERYFKSHIVSLGQHEFGVRGLTPRKQYLLRAAELNAKGQAENEHARKDEFKFLPRAFLRLAEQANVTAIRISFTRRRQKRIVTKPTGQPRGR